jgi:hypothetical protein
MKLENPALQHPCTPVWELPDTDNFHKIRPLKLTDQKEKCFLRKSLKGKIAVSEFFF